MKTADPGRSTFLRLAAGALALVASANAPAQFSGRRSAKERPTRAREPGQQSAESRLAQSLGEFRDDLKLTTDQQPAWDRYARALESFQQDAARERRRARTLSAMTVPERIGHLVDVARNRYAATEEIAGAARGLYAALTPEQQSLANPGLAGIAEMVAGAGSASRAPAAAPRRAERAPEREQP